MSAPRSLGVRGHVLRRALVAAGIALLAIAAEPPSGDPLARALAEQQERAAAHPDDARVQNDLGNLLALSGDARSAAAAYRQALADDPANATAHYNLGLLLLDQREIRQSRKELLQALSIDPDFAKAYYYLGVVYARRHRLRRAQSYYARAFELDPRLADPNQNPSIVGNRQALAAELLAWQHEVPPGPSRVYAQVGRIAKQADLVPPAEQPPAAAPATQSESSPVSSDGGYARSYNAPPRPEGKPYGKRKASVGEERPRVLDASSLGSGTVNQAQPAGARPRARRRERTRTATGVPVRGAPVVSSPTGRTPGNATPAPSYVAPGGVYQASPRSTGQIDSTLVPVDPGRFAVGC